MTSDECERMAAVMAERDNLQSKLTACEEREARQREWAKTAEAERDAWSGRCTLATKERREVEIELDERAARIEMLEVAIDKVLEKEGNGTKAYPSPDEAGAFYSALLFLRQARAALAPTAPAPRSSSSCLTEEDMPAEACTECGSAACEGTHMVKPDGIVDAHGNKPAETPAPTEYTVTLPTSYKAVETPAPIPDLWKCAACRSDTVADAVAAAKVTEGVTADLRAELAAEQRRTQEHIRDKHRILGEYEEQTKKLRVALAKAEEENARLKSIAQELCSDAHTVLLTGGTQGKEQLWRSVDSFPYEVPGAIAAFDAAPNLLKRSRRWAGAPTANAGENESATSTPPSANAEQLRALAKAEEESAWLKIERDSYRDMGRQVAEHDEAEEQAHAATKARLGRAVAALQHVAERVRFHGRDIGMSLSQLMPPVDAILADDESKAAGEYVRALEAALEWYAHKHHYARGAGLNVVEDDRGQRAREALAKVDARRGQGGGRP